MMALNPMIGYLFYMNYMFDVKEPAQPRVKLAANENCNITIKNNILINIRVQGTPPDDLDFSNMGLAAVDENVFTHWINLWTLNLANNSIRFLPEFVFIYLENLRKLNLANNELVSLNFCYGLRNLQFLDIRNNSVKKISRGDFFVLPPTVVILLKGNPVRLLSAGMFKEVAPRIANNGNIEKQISYNSGNYKIERFTKKNIFYVYRNNYGIKDDDCIKKSSTESNYIFLNGNSLTNMTACNFSRFTELVELELSWNLIEVSDIDWLSGPSTLKELDLSNNLLTTIRPGFCRYLQDLALLRLWSNKISHLEIGAFSGLKNIEAIWLNENELTEIPIGLFSELTMLTFLDLSVNKIHTLKAGTFVNVPSKELYLDENQLKEIEPDMFRIKGLKVLNLEYNLLKTIPRNFTREMNDIFELSLSGNSIQKLKNHTLHGLPDNATIHLSEFEIIEGGVFLPE